MPQRTTFTLEDENFAFLKAAAGTNRSAYINKLLWEERQRIQEKTILNANQEEAANSDYLDELSKWGITLVDGLHP